ncbi:MAG: hypothetical protein Q8L92_02150 [Rubrivivax sp.]|nr:hypothetical protein [Rubrivivax sp.]
MKFRFLLIPLLALAGAIALPAAATSGFTPVRGEAGFSTHAMRSPTTRSAVLHELEAWKRNPVTADGWREVGGEAGWEFVGAYGGGKTRAAVIDEMLQARSNPVSPSGWLEVGGEIGAVYVVVPARTRSAAFDPTREATRGLSRSDHMRSSTHMQR